jgi:hypothetical protein
MKDPKCGKCAETFEADSGQDRCENCAPWQYVDQPAWITEHLSGADIAAIRQGGCASGAYMPAVTYWQAGETMAEYGDDVLQFLEDAFGELPTVPHGESWMGIAAFFLSTAVECWVGQFDDGDWDDEWHPPTSPN